MSGVEVVRFEARFVTDAYVGWLNDPEVNRYLESRYVRHDLDGTAAFARQQMADDSVLFFAILLDGTHVGNVKIGPRNANHGTADLGIMIGASAARGRGVGTQAIAAATEHAFGADFARKLTASCYSGNAASARAFVKAGWTAEGSRPDHFTDGEGRLHDMLMFGAFKDTWSRNA